MAKQKEYVSKAGNKYIFQKVSISQWMDILDEAEATGRAKRTVMYPAILENIVVQPKMTVDDFDRDGYDGYEELEEVVKEAGRFQRGK